MFGTTVLLLKIYATLVTVPSHGFHHSTESDVLDFTKISEYSICAKRQDPILCAHQPSVASQWRLLGCVAALSWKHEMGHRCQQRDMWCDRCRHTFDHQTSLAQPGIPTVR